jgi:lysozyme
MRDEGLKLKPYRDTVGKLTIGVGRNLDDVGISKGEAELMLSNDVGLTGHALLSALPWTATLDQARFGVLLNMAFNMGVSGLLQFQNMLSFVKAGSWMSAADEMLRSKWAEQVGERAKRLATQMSTGQWT